MNGIVIYNRFVGPEEAAKKFELVRARIAAWPKIDRQVVTAEMLEKADSPPPESDAPNLRALVINRYKIKESKSAHF